MSIRGNQRSHWSVFYLGKCGLMTIISSFLSLLNVNNLYTPHSKGGLSSALYHLNELIFYTLC